MKISKVDNKKTTKKNIVRSKTRQRKSDSEKVRIDIEQQTAIKQKHEQEKLELQKKRDELYKDITNPDNFYVTNKNMMEELIKWRDSCPEDVEKRVISSELAKMFLMIAYRFTNHVYFKNYPKEVKEDMVSYASEKFVTGIKNYNFKFTKPFAYFTQSCFNSFRTVLTKYYKQINIKRSLQKKKLTEIESFMPGSGLKKSLDNMMANDEYIDYD